jgi:hypothetical protein
LVPAHGFRESSSGAQRSSARRIKPSPSRKIAAFGSKIYGISIGSIARLCDFSPAMNHDSFDSHGWLVLRNVVQRTDLEDLNRVFNQLMQAPFTAAHNASISGENASA